MKKSKGINAVAWFNGQSFHGTMPVTVIRAVENTCARCGEYLRHSENCIELKYEQQRQDEAIRAAMVERGKGEVL